MSDKFYTESGSLNEDAVKESYYAMLRGFNVPVYDSMKGDDFWVCDFLQGDVTKLGMAGIFWMNPKGVYGETGTQTYDGDFKGEKFGYLGHEIYLLPNQTLPEHHHAGGAEGYAPKMEGWLVRNGSARFFGEFDSGQGEKLISELPEDERPWGYGEEWFNCKYYVEKNAGEIWELVDPESWHFVQAGSEGTVISEFASYHNHVDFSKPGMVFDNSK